MNNPKTETRTLNRGKMKVQMFVVPLLGESLFPHFRERDFLMHWITKPGTSVAEERRMAIQVSRELRAIPRPRA